MAGRVGMPTSPLPNLKTVRDKSGLSQRELARRSGVTHVNISRIENGQPATLPTTKKLARALGVPGEVLLGEKDLGDTAPKGPAPPSAEERRFSYLRGFEELARSAASRLQRAIDSEDIDVGQVDQVAQFHEDLQRVVVQEIGLLRSVQTLPEEELQAQERVAVSLDDLRSVIDQGYTAAINALQDRKAEVRDLGKLCSPEEASNRAETTPRSA